MTDEDVADLRDFLSKDLRPCDRETYARFLDGGPALDPDQIREILGHEAPLS